MKYVVIHHVEEWSQYRGGGEYTNHGYNDFNIHPFEGEVAREQMARFIAERLSDGEHAEDQPRSFIVVGSFEGLERAGGYGTSSGIDSIRVVAGWHEDAQAQHTEEVEAVELESWLRARVRELIRKPKGGRK